MIWLLKYDSFGKLRLKKLIGMGGGDDGDYWHLKSKFISNSMWIDTFYTSNEDFDTHESEEDSIVTKNTFYNNFSIQTDTILNKHFSIKK